jgi:putative peptidoglycan lipid II flippase
VLLGLSMVTSQQHLALQLMMIMLPFMPLVCLVAILGAMLQVHGRFGPTAAAPIMLNLFIVGATVAFAGTKTGGVGVGVGVSERAHIAIVAASVLVAGIVQVIWSLLALRRTKQGEGWWTGIDEARSARPHMRTVLSQAGPMFLGLGVLQLNTFLDGLIASYPSVFGPTIFGVAFPLQEGALTALNNAQRLYEFPLGVFGIAIATAIFPALARVASKMNHGDHGGHGASERDATHDSPIPLRDLRGESDEFADILRRGLRLVVFIGLPASVGLMLVRVPLTAAVLQGRNFTAADTQRVAFVLMGYAPAIWAYSMTHVLTRAFYARGDSMTPVRVAIGMVGLNLVLNLTLIWTPLKEAGLAWSTAFCAIVQVALLLRLTRRYAAHVVSREVVHSWARTALATMTMATIVWLAMSVITPPASLVGTWRWAMIQLAFAVPIGMLAMWVAATMLKMPERWWAMGKST